MKMHIEFMQGDNVHLSLHYSELQSRIAGLFGIRPDSQGGKDGGAEGWREEIVLSVLALHTGIPNFGGSSLSCFQSS
jgi:hypothetical protein